MPTYLDELLDGARRRVAQARREEPLEALRERAQSVAAPPSILDPLRLPGVQVIAEVKRASPSRGSLASGVDARELASAYLRGGAAAVSVLTEPERFDGALADLADVSTLGAPTLRKDFVLDAYQVWEARACGASAVLLIAAALSTEELRQLHDVVETAGMTALVEVHDEQEAEGLRGSGVRLVGINARDLRTFEVDRDAFARIRPLFDDVVAVAESGVRDADDIRRLAAEGADAVLVGESLVVADDPAAEVAELVLSGRESPDTARERSRT